MKSKTVYDKTIDPTKPLFRYDSKTDTYFVYCNRGYVFSFSGKVLGVFESRRIEVIQRHERDPWEDRLDKVYYIIYDGPRIPPVVSVEVIDFVSGALRYLQWDEEAYYEHKVVAIRRSDYDKFAETTSSYVSLKKFIFDYFKNTRNRHKLAFAGIRRIHRLYKWELRNEQRRLEKFQEKRLGVKKIDLSVQDVIEGRRYPKGKLIRVK